MSPLSTSWESLQLIIPNMLQLGTIGYPFVNPGPVGGNGRLADSEEEVTLDDELELYIRWWQVNTFLPVLHFYKPPSAFPTSKVGGS